jgi:tRNA-uridine 2-sulfurtransferase
VSPKKHVLVAMSGGVDSSMAAALILEQGFTVTGIMLNLWSDPSCETQNACCTPEAQRLAKTTANQLGIPFYVIDAKDIFYKEVVQYFINSYEQGVTPNPCWVCNVKVKWNILLKQLEYFAADYVTTGHYARLAQDKKNDFHLSVARDKKKDQSYVLSGLTQYELARTFFPLGELTKIKVREKALQLGLNTADRPESQDLCFLGKKSPEQFLEELHVRYNRVGDIIDTKGKVLGRHNGISSYTIGQRKGIRIAAVEPYYVIRKEVIANKLVIGYKADLGGYKFYASDLNWISGKVPGLPRSVQLQIRYHAKKVEAIINEGPKGRIDVTSSIILRDITPGQIAVFYDGDEVVGSGIIQ